MLRAFFGRHKTASTWARSILFEAAAALGLSILVIHVPEQWQAKGHETIGDLVRAEKPDLLVMTNATQADFESLPPLRGLNVIRDPRDIIVSGYFSHLHSHPESLLGLTFDDLVAHRKVLQTLDAEAGLFQEIEFSGKFLDPMSEWNYANPGVLEFTMEDMVKDPLTAWGRALRHLELVTPEGSGPERFGTAAFHWNLASRRETPKSLAVLRRVLPPVPLRRLPGSYVASTVNRFTFAHISGGRQPGQEDVKSHYRRGIPGDWRNHLNAAHLAAIGARYGDLIQRLGYPD